MIVHIGGGARSLGDDLPYLRKIIDVVREGGDEISRNWIEITNHNVTVKEIKPEQVDWKDIASQNKLALARADVYIADVTAYRLSNGYELAQALQQNKPVLLVARKSFKQFAISGVQNDLLTMQEYSTQEELSEIVAKFLEQNRIPTDLKTVEIPLDLELYRYIKQQETNTGRATSDILYELAKRGLKKDLTTVKDMPC